MLQNTLISYTYCSYATITIQALCYRTQLSAIRIVHMTLSPFRRYVIEHTYQLYVLFICHYHHLGVRLQNTLISYTYCSYVTITIQALGYRTQLSAIRIVHMSLSPFRRQVKEHTYQLYVLVICHYYHIYVRLQNTLISYTYWSYVTITIYTLGYRTHLSVIRIGHMPLSPYRRYVIEHTYQLYVLVICHYHHIDVML